MADPRRKLGKVAVLGLGYGMGAPRFREHAADEGVDWSAVSMTPEKVVEAWRAANPLIAGSRPEGFEQRCGALLATAQQGRESSRARAQRAIGGHLTFRMQGADLLCVFQAGGSSATSRRVSSARRAGPTRTLSSVTVSVSGQGTVASGPRTRCRPSRVTSSPQRLCASKPSVSTSCCTCTMRWSASSMPRAPKQACCSWGGWLCEELPPWAGGLLTVAASVRAGAEFAQRLERPEKAPAPPARGRGRDRKRLASHGQEDSGTGEPHGRRPRRAPRHWRPGMVQGPGDGPLPGGLRA